jgi:peroxiredoxin (alkyl hydroperoxide reductase subunit C)
MMCDPISEVKVGQAVPDFKLAVYNPTENSFGEISLAGLKEQKKWTILFFYPADFTFV